MTTEYKAGQVKTINWNQASERGLVARINTEILHPLGLAMMRSPGDGMSPGLMLSVDGTPFYYADGGDVSAEELLAFICAIGCSDELADWMSDVDEGKDEPQPADAAGVRAHFEGILRRAKAAGLYPVKT